MPTDKTEPKTIPSLARTISELNKRYGVNTIGTVKNMEHLQISRVKTGLPHLDEGLGGGMPLGGMVELYGPEHSGKSLLSLLTIKSAQTMGLDCIYIDAENSFDDVWAKKLGVDTEKLIVTQIGIAEDIIDMIAKLLESKPGVIVIDSVAGMITRGEFEGEADQQFMAPKARLMSRGLAKLNTLNEKTLIIWVNQLRSTLVMYGVKTTTPGGNALRHFASIRIEVKRDSTLITKTGKVTDKDVIGQRAVWKITKNKTSEPYKYGSFELIYDGPVISE